MRDWLKSAGQGLGGIGLLIGALVYLANVWRASQERAGELIGLLTLVATEIAINERTLDNLIREPHRLVTPANKLLKTNVWNHNSSRIARLLEDHSVFLHMARFYEDVQLIEEGARHGAANRVDLEELRRSAEICRRRGRSIRSMISRYVGSTLATEGGK